MTGEDETDRDLEGRFARLRREENARGEDYRRFCARMAAMARRRERHGWPVLAALAAAAAVALLLLLVPRGPGGAPPRAAAGVDLSTTSLRMPTDFLLDTPGSDLLRSVPAFGAPDLTAAGGAVHAPGATPSPEEPS